MKGGRILGAGLLASILIWSGCSSSGPTAIAGGTAPVNNVLPLSVNLGVDGNYADGLFTSVTVCVPGTVNCQTIDNVLVDTGSFGLRLLGSELTLPLPDVGDSSGNPIAECAAFADSFNWGPVATADVDLAGEVAPAVPIQIMGQSGFAAPPSACTSSGVPEQDTQALLGANGVLGVGVFTYDCGDGCTPQSATVPPVYFGCPSAGCTPELVSLQDQVQNPVWLFTTDNNGIEITLPSVPAGGIGTASGTLTFGLSTQSDNTLGGTVLDTDNNGDLATNYAGTTYSGTVLDSGSNGNFFLDSTTLNLPLCSGSEDVFYCPATNVGYTATNQSAGTGPPAQQIANWSVGNAVDLFNTGYAAFNDIAGPNPGYFDFGLPFFFGVPIFVGIDGMVAAGNTGPFFSY